MAQNKDNETEKNPVDLEKEKTTKEVKIIFEGDILAKNPGELILPDQVLPPNLFILPVNSALVFPTMMAPVGVNKPRYVSMIEEAINRQRIIGIVMTKETEVSEKTTPNDLYEWGVAVKILKRIKLPDNSINILVSSIKRFRKKRVLSESPYMVFETEYFDDSLETSTQMDALSRTVINHVKKLSDVNPFFTEEMKLAMINAPTPGVLADLVAFSLSLDKKDSQSLLETLNVKERFQKLLFHLKREQDVASVQRKIADEVNGRITKMQREFFLKEQIKTIKQELGTEVDSKEKFHKRLKDSIEASGMAGEAKKVALEELEKFETMPEHFPEHNVIRNYLETMCALPWKNETKDKLNLDNAQKILDDDHYGLERVKERIIEFLAVRKLKNDPKGSILCLVGPPGVGKTSVGKSVARAMGRKFYRFSLGGMRDEAEIKGHRRTYIGAMPGKIIQSIKRVGTKNPVLMLDEIDKLGQSFHGDPASALLEVLDPEQNSAFVDHYMDVPFDLSRVLFIATANLKSSIPSPLLDRMEVIELPGYTLEEKEQIATKFVIPREFGENGIKKSMIKIDKAAIRKIMQDYAREPGLRSLQKLINRVARKAAAIIVRGQQRNGRGVKRIHISVSNLKKWLGPKVFYNEVAERITAPGVVVGMAWTQAGGDLLFIEARDIAGSGGLKITGQLGDVMSESASIAWSYVKRKLFEENVITPALLKEKDVHLHVPAGAVPKDGPSAGVTMATALYSLFTNKVCKQKLSMTGELSLIGKVLPVGGIKEKLLAAKRAGIKDVILPKQNEKDIEDVPKYALKGMTLHFVAHVDEVLALAFGEYSKKTKNNPRKRNKTKKTQSLKVAKN